MDLMNYVPPSKDATIRVQITKRVNVRGAPCDAGSILHLPENQAHTLIDAGQAKLDEPSVLIRVLKACQVDGMELAEGYIGKLPRNTAIDLVYSEKASPASNRPTT